MLKKRNNGVCASNFNKRQTVNNENGPEQGGWGKKYTTISIGHLILNAKRQKQTTLHHNSPPLHIKPSAMHNKTLYSTPPCSLLPLISPPNQTKFEANM